MELATLWVLAAAMALLAGAWGIRNRRAGYRRPAGRPLLEEGFLLLRRFEKAEPVPQSAPAPIGEETPVAQLVSLSLAVQSISPAQVPEQEKVEDREVIHSPT